MSYNRLMVRADRSVSFATGVRTMLFVPADDRRKCERAWASGADVLVFDLEDSVAPDAKEGARTVLGKVLGDRDPGPAAVVRVNAPDSPQGERDLAALAGVELDAVMIPKAEPARVRMAARRGLPMIALVETAAGVLRAEEVASTDGVALLAFGPVDLIAEIGCQPSPEGGELLFARSRIVLASAAAGLSSPIDGPCVSIDDVDALRAEARHARRLGFGGKACIHPRQVEEIRLAFSPSEEELEWATRVTAAYEAGRERGSGVVSVRGQMIDVPVARRAYAILERDGGRG